MSVVIGTLEGGLLHWAADEKKRVAMSVYLEIPGKGKIDQHKDDDKTVFAYNVSDAGVLRIVVSNPDDGSWAVTREYSPAAWSEVSGKRFVGKLDDLGGFLGGTAQPKAGRMVSY
jgi:hypothetical protein